MKTRLPVLAQLRNPAAQDTAVLYVGHMAGAGTGFIVALVVARHLGPAEYAVVTAYMLLVDILAGFTDFGLGTGLIKFATPLLRSARERSYAYFRAALYAELVAGALVLVAGLSLSGLLEKLIRHDLPGDVLPLAVVAAAVTSAAAYVAAAQSAHKLFKRSAALAVGVGVLRLGAVMALLYTSSLTLTSVLWVFAAVAFIAAAAGFATTPRDYLRRVPDGAVRRAAGDILRFSGWLTLTFFITSVMGRLDFFYLYRIRGAHEAGVYAAAVQLSLAVTILIGALTTVLTPHVSERTTYAAKVDFLKRCLPAVTLVAGMLVLSSVTFPVLVRVLFGAEYREAAVPLMILIAHLALNVVMIPITLTLIPLGKMSVGTAVSAVQLLVAILLYPVLIERAGAVGAALTVLVASLISLIINSLVVRRLLHRERHEERRAMAMQGDRLV